MRIRRTASLAGGLSRREKLRLVSLCAMLVFVLVAIRWSSRPDSWYWLTGQPSERGGEEKVGSGSLTEVPPGTPDSSHASVKLDRHHSQPSRFNKTVSSGASHKKPPSSQQSVGGRLPLKSEEEAGSSRQGTSSDSVSSASKKRRFEKESLGKPGNSALPFDSQSKTEDRRSATELTKLLAKVKDDTLGIRHFEQQAYERLLVELRKKDTAGQRAVCPDYTVLMLEPDQFRGKLVRFDGLLRRLVAFRPEPNRVGLNRLFEAWVFVEGRAGQPCRVVCLEPPQGVKEALRVQPPLPVRVVGFFFKRFGYVDAEGRLATAPLILARRLRVLSVQSMYERGNVSWWLGVGLLTLTGLAAVFVVWFFYGERRFRRTVLKRVVTVSEENVTALEPPEVIEGPDEVLFVPKEPPAPSPPAGVKDLFLDEDGNT